MKRRMLFVVSVAAAAALIGCSKEPATEIESARQALQNAEGAEAAQYAPQDLAQAKEAMAALETELQAQSKKFAPFRSYKRASELAAAAAQTGTQAASQAHAGKTQAMTEATAAIAAAKASLEAALAEIEAAPVGKGTLADIEAMKQDLVGVGETLNQVEAAFRAERFGEATAKANSAKAGAENVRAAILAASQAKQASAGSRG